jgi:hypothetical protein
MMVEIYSYYQQRAQINREQVIHALDWFDMTHDLRWLTSAMDWCKSAEGYERLVARMVQAG